MSGRSKRPKSKTRKDKLPSPTMAPSDADDLDDLNRIAAIQVTRQGPLPDAAEMARYQQIDPELPLRIVGMAERQSQHRMGLERKAIEDEARDRKLGWIERRIGQLFGLLIAMSGISAGAVVVVMSQTVWGAAAGAAIAGTPLFFMVRVMVLGRRDKDG